MSRKLFLIIIIFIIIIIALFISKILFQNQNNIITRNDSFALVNLDNIHSISISYLSKTKNLTDEQKNFFVQTLKNFKYPYINEELLIVSNDYKIDFHNGIYFTFGNFGTEVDVFEKNEKIFTTQVSAEFLNYIRNLFDNPSDTTNNTNNTITL